MEVLCVYQFVLFVTVYDWHYMNKQTWYVGAGVNICVYPNIAHEWVKLFLGICLAANSFPLLVLEI